MKLPKKFYTRDNVVQIAQDLLGKVLYTRVSGKLTAGIITETEAYAGITDRASHAYGNRRTQRTEVMYSPGGAAYVYLCYGIHHLFNVVTNKRDIPHAVLIRSVKPFKGEGIILKRRKKIKADEKICDGPGTVSEALGINVSHTGTELSGNLIWIEDNGIKVLEKEIIKSPRIGVDYAGADALLPYRFRAKI
jgi:DNA-3-methyladenine glycosylase